MLNENVKDYLDNLEFPEVHALEEGTSLLADVLEWIAILHTGRVLSDDEVLDFAKCLTNTTEVIRATLWTGLKTNMDNMFAVHPYIERSMMKIADWANYKGEAKEQIKQFSFWSADVRKDLQELGLIDPEELCSTMAKVEFRAFNKYVELY